MNNANVLLLILLTLSYLVLLSNTIKISPSYEQYQQENLIKTFIQFREKMLKYKSYDQNQIDPNILISLKKDLTTSMIDLQDYKSISIQQEHEIPLEMLQVENINAPISDSKIFTKINNIKKDFKLDSKTKSLR